VLTLGIDTATSRVAVAIGRDGRVLGERHVDGARRHAEELVPAIDAVCTDAGVALEAVAAVAVGIGPGLFTGLRVGVTTARTLAQVLDVPLIGIPSLDLVAFPCRGRARRIAAVIDARRQEVFVARYRAVPDGIEPIGDRTVESPDALVAALAASAADWLVVGDGALEYADRFAALDRVELGGPEDAAPSVAALVELAATRLREGDVRRFDEVAPLYLRRSDAEIAWDLR
jgi:tRNA threonylcarbamoyladenosine biosynthesis protein TsaB